MKNKNTLLNFCLIIFMCVGFSACENSIMEAWWEEKEREPEYIALLKMIPQITYETIFETKFEIIYERLPAEIIHETIIEERIIYQTEFIYETIVEQLPAEIIYEIITEIVTEYETIFETVFNEIIVEVEKRVEVKRDPTVEEIIEYLKQHPELIIDIITENNDIREQIIEIILEHFITEEHIRYIIQKLPPEVLYEYLTEEQIKFIVQKQPPEMILQQMTIIGIEYILFSSDADVYNANSPNFESSLSVAEKNTNDHIVSLMAGALADNPEYLLIIHGHASPTVFSEEEKQALERLSLNRANSVAKKLREIFQDNSGEPINESRVSIVGYGGENNLSVPSTTYAGLNRRVEMILFKIDTIKM